MGRFGIVVLLGWASVLAGWCRPVDGVIFLTETVDVLNLYPIVESGLTYTSNVNLEPGSAEGDAYFNARGGVGMAPRLAERLSLQALVTEEVYQYARFSSLNFSKFKVGAGLAWTVPGIEAVAIVRYEFERFFDGETLDPFLTKNAVVVGLSRTLFSDRVITFPMGWKSSFAVDVQPSVARRNKHEVWMTTVIYPSRATELSAYWLGTLYHYPATSRADFTQEVGGGAAVRLTRWIRLAASGGFSANFSTDSRFNYNVATVGGTINVVLSF